MKTMKTVIVSVFATLLLLAQMTVIADDLPDVSHDGFLLIRGTGVKAVSMKPRADLSGYDRVAILDTYVTFHKKWQRDHNRDAIGLEGRVSDDEMRKEAPVQ